MYVIPHKPSIDEMTSLVLAVTRCVQCADPSVQQCQLRTDLRNALVPFMPGSWWTQESTQAEAYADEAIQTSFA
jgi:hypothetical protein